MLDFIHDIIRAYSYIKKKTCKMSNNVHKVQNKLSIYLMINAN